MKKAIFCITLFFSLLQHAYSQFGPPIGGVGSIIVALSQRSTVLYSDTTFEIDQLKFKITETYAFRNKIKTTIILSNLSDNFKIIKSEDFTIMDSDSNMITVNAKKPIVIAPKSSKKIGLLAETNASFKLYDIQIGLKRIFTSSSPSVMKLNLFNLHIEGMESMKNNVIEILRTKCIATPNGTVKAYFKVAYTGGKFLGIYVSNAMLVSANRKAYPNIAQKSKLTYYPDEKVSVTLMLEFENFSPNFDGQNCDKIALENVFVEYEPISSTKPLEFHVYENGLEKGEAPKEKKYPEHPEEKNYPESSED